MKNYLEETATVIRLEKLIKAGEKQRFCDRLSSRMVSCAAVLPVGEHIGWQMTIPKKGRICMDVFGSESLSESDLKWIAEKSAVPSKKIKPAKGCPCGVLYELYLPVADEAPAAVGFTASAASSDESFSKWPEAYSSQFKELVELLRGDGAVFRAVIGAADEEEQLLCRKKVMKTFCSRRLDITAYIGKPVRTRFLLRLSSAPSVRLKSVLEEAIHGVRLRYIGSLTEKAAAAVWERPLDEGRVLPDYAARIMLMEPELKQSVIGIEVCEEEMKNIPAAHKNTKSKDAVTIGRADDVTGTKRRITVGELDLRRHYQIIGQTGCGKSTMLTSLILSAVEQGHGLTFFDPHGTTIDMVLRCLPEKYAGRVRVVRVGDADNPVPLNIWDSGDPLLEERNISDLCELFSDIFDPHREGFTGPRFERWLAVFAKLSLAYLGRQASLESIAVISQSRENMQKAARLIRYDYPELYRTVINEYVNDHSNDFTNVLNWYLCKFQRICAVEQLRKTLGAGANALDFNHSIDTDAVTLIDLGSPAIGTHAARIVGTLTMMKLWNAVIQRRDRERTHLIIVDEASLFQTNPMPRILAEGRKFGAACVLCHQHAAQLTPIIREALEANSANFSAFRLSPKDAQTAAVRFDDPGMRVTLTRLNAFHAVTTLSVDGVQTKPFTLETVRPKKQKNAEEIAAKIESDSIEKLVKPFRKDRALTPGEIQRFLDQGIWPVIREEDNLCLNHITEFETDDNESATEDNADAPYTPETFLKRWNDYRNSRKSA